MGGATIAANANITAATAAMAINAIVIELCFLFITNMVLCG
jgi:hypothetical protein